MKSKNLVKIIAAVLVSFSFSGMANANLITNGSFENGTSIPAGGHIQLSAGDARISGWSITGGTIDWINTTWAASDGTKSIDMNGTSAGTITSNVFNTIIGNSYDVTFDMSGNWFGGQATKNLLLLVDGINSAFTVDQPTSFSRADIGWEQMSYSFTATQTTAQLQFSGVHSDGHAWGAALDNVAVIAARSSVPEPTSLALLGLGLVGFGFSRRKKSAL